MLLITLTAVLLTVSLTAQPAIGWIVGFACVPLVGAACAAWGTQRVWGYGALVDILAGGPILVVHSAVTGFPQTGLAWRVPLYMVGAVLLLLLARRSPFPDWLLPVRGRWARILATTLACFAMFGVYVGEIAYGFIARPGAWFVLLAFFPLVPLAVAYVYQLGEFLITDSSTEAQ